MSAQSVITLALESSAGLASVAVARGGEVLAQARHEAAHGHAAWIITLAEDALAEAKLGFDDIDVLVAGRGPGSFTGIRVALAAAKGLGLSLGLAPVGVSSLAAMAHGAALAHGDADGPSPVISVIDSRRKSLYFQAFAPDGTAMGEVQDGSDEDLLALARTLEASSPVIITGHDGPDLAARLAAEGHDARSGQAGFPQAADLCRYLNAHPARDEGREPLYLAPPLISTSGAS